MSWWDEAACQSVDPGLFFTDRPHQAKLICAGCPVQPECLDWAVTYGEVGVWGGTTDLERDLLRWGWGRAMREPVHGTDAGYTAHTRYPELFGVACGACLAAHADANSRRRRAVAAERVRAVRVANVRRMVG